MSLKDKLNSYFEEIDAVILRRQHPVTGLLPASTAVNEHGDYRDAWVRDNVYSILAVWGLALAYRRLDDDEGRGYALEHAVVKLMRGLLFAMMRQSDKVEAFKASLDPLDALHAKYDTATGDTVVADDAWGHLQLDATSLYLLMLGQMTASGLQIIYTLDEVNFVQNLIFYIGRAYRTPDYGIWERGDKTNHGEPELNASSVGMAKAALEALDGLDLFGMYGSQASVIHVLPDEIARARTTLEALLPRESSSKETDAALLSVISYPAFAIDDEALVARTRQVLVDKLEGKYGLKRFLRDGHQTVIEDPERLHYEPDELKQFERLESQWPLFFTYLILDGVFRDDHSAVGRYRAKLAAVIVEQDGVGLIPELYYVPVESIEAERAKPNSVKRSPNDNLPLVWAQSLYYLGNLLEDGLISIHELDPLGRHRRSAPVMPVVQVALLAETPDLQQELAALGVEAQIPQEIQPVALRSATDLSAAYYQIGRNDKLGLTGRPLRQLLSLSTSNVFLLAGEASVCPPAFTDVKSFYLSLDPEYFLERVRNELAYVARHWSFIGRPTVTLLITTELFRAGRAPLLALLYALRSGRIGEVAIKLAPLQFLLQRAATERVDELHDLSFVPERAGLNPGTMLIADLNATRPLSQDDELTLELETNKTALSKRLWASRNLYEQVEVLEALLRLEGSSVTAPNGESYFLERLLDDVYAFAAKAQLWAIIRRAAGLLGKVDVALSDSVTDILVNQKSLVVGKSYTERSLITRPMPQGELLARIAEFCRGDVRDRVLTQEVLVYLGSLVRAEPDLFKGLLTVRVGYLILLLASDLARELSATQDEGYACLMHLPPHEIQTRLRDVLGSYEEKEEILQGQESLSANRPAGLEWRGIEISEPVPEEGWWRWREREGIISRVPAGFYANVWQLMEHAEGLIIGDKLERRNRLESRTLLSATTAGEKKFALRVEHLLNKISSPEYRQLNVEALDVLYELTEQNPDLKLKDYLVLDIIIGHAVRLAYQDQYPEQAKHYETNKASAWAAFYGLAPAETRAYLISAVDFLLESSAVV